MEVTGIPGSLVGSVAGSVGSAWLSFKGMKTTAPCLIISSMLLMMFFATGLLSLHLVVVGPSVPPWMPLSSMLGSSATSIGSSSNSKTATIPFRNVTGQILDELSKNGTTACYDERTDRTDIVGLDATLLTNVVHRFWLQSYTSNGTRRCAGGDYYEADLSSDLWKSRPLVEDLHNGTYAVEFMVPDTFAGTYNFSATLLFGAYHGLDYHAEKWGAWWPFVTRQLNFVSATPDANANVPATADLLINRLKQCGTEDFRKPEWSGRWTRPWANNSCPPDSESRYAHCFPESEACLSPWCDGKPWRLESTGWSYSAHCSFHIFEPEEAWECLDGRWLFFWGDSNMQDTIRNLLFFVLQIPQPEKSLLRDWQLSRTFESFFINPTKPYQWLHISSLFNGHPNRDGSGVGLDTLQNSGHRENVRRHFQDALYPDAVIMNSGLHDGWRFNTVQNYANSVDRAMEFWGETLANVSGKPPTVVYRTSIAPAGSSRAMQSNPWKLEVFNKIITEKVQSTFPDARMVDAFDLSFPWHFDHTCSDGGHFGRAPGVRKWPWFDNPHQYFVDVMLVHILLNSICPIPSSSA